MLEAINYQDRIKSSWIAAESYSRRKQSRHTAEMNLISRALPKIAGCHSALDVPCGVGRATILLAEKGFKTMGADLGDGAVAFSRKAVREAGVTAGIHKDDIERLSFPAGAFDAILCFRMFHHFPTEEIRTRVIAELCRVAKKYVLISYLRPFAVTSIRRRLELEFTGRKHKQHTTSLRTLKNYFSGQGFAFIADYSQLPFFHTLHLAVFQKAGG